MSTGKKRFCSDDEKREICDQATALDVSVAQGARRYAVNANLIHKWLKDRRFVSEVGLVEDVLDVKAFLPVEIDAVVSSDEATIITTSPATANTTLSASRVDIMLSDGRRILIEGPTSLLAVVGLVQESSVLSLFPATYGFGLRQA
jgi:transposase